MTMAVLYKKLLLNITTSIAKITNAGRPNNSSASAMPAIYVKEETGEATKISCIL
jgi:hypothetical protein